MKSSEFTTKLEEAGTLKSQTCKKTHDWEDPAFSGKRTRGSMRAGSTARKTQRSLRTQQQRKYISFCLKSDSDAVTLTFDILTAK